MILRLELTANKHTTTIQYTVNKIQTYTHIAIEGKTIASGLTSVEIFRLRCQSLCSYLVMAPALYFVLYSVFV